MILPPVDCQVRLLTNPSNELISEINKIYDLNFDYVEIGIEVPEGNPDIINKKRDEILKLLDRIRQTGLNFFIFLY